MKLADYLETRSIKPAHFAKSLEVQVSTVTRIMTGERRPSLSLAIKIERLTQGRVTCADFAEEGEA